MLRSFAPVLVLLSLGAVACGGSSNDTTGENPPASGPLASGGAGGGGAASGGGSGASGAGGAVDSFPSPIVAGTPETDALASSPARCGQPAYTWLSSGDLGRVKAHEKTKSYTSGTLDALAATANVPLPVTLQYDVDVHVITYGTQDRGAPIDATTVVAWPKDVPDGTPPLPTLVVLHGTSGFTDGCGPSSDPTTMLLAAAFASSGFIVVVPDYIGLKATPPPTGFLHPYLVGQATAIASLDAIRTLGNLPDEIKVGGAKPSPDVVFIGGSQGGHAALWLDRLAPYYARELRLRGGAATVPPADMLTESTLALTTVRESSGNMIAFFGATAGWYGAKLSDVFVSPYDTDVPTALASSCDPTKDVTLPTSLDMVFPGPLLDAAKNGALASFPTWGCVVADNGLTTTSIPRIQKDDPSYGILFVTGSADQLVDTPTERAAFPSLCQGGMPMQYLECDGASHTKTTLWALPEILSFLQDRLAGKALAPTCEVPAAVTCKGTPPM